MRGKDWQQDEIEFLKEHFANMTLRELQREIFRNFDVLRSETAIRVMANRDLKLVKRCKYQEREPIQLQRITHPRPGVTVHRLL